MFANQSKLTDTDIVRLVRLKSQAGAEALYDRYATALLLSIFHIVHQKKLSEDILEQAFIKIWNDFDFYPPQQQKLFTWMVTIARNSAIEILQAKFPQTASDQIKLKPKCIHGPVISLVKA